MLVISSEKKKLTLNVEQVNFTIKKRINPRFFNWHVKELDFHF